MSKKPAQNSGSAAKKPPEGRRFKKGQSGNPGGRPKGIMSYILLKTKDGKELGDFAMKVMRGEPVGFRPLADGSNLAIVPELKDRLEALKFLADRGLGKPVQEQDINLTGGGGVVIYLPKEDGEDEK